MPSRIVPAAAVALSVLAAVPLSAAPGGPMGVLPKGKWACETGGDATGATGIRQPEMDFVVTRGSSYKTDKGAGTYLLTSHRLVFSTGPFKGVTLRWVRPNFIRRTDAAGKDTDVRCVRNPANR